MREKVFIISDILNKYNEDYVYEEPNVKQGKIISSNNNFKYSGLTRGAAVKINLTSDNYKFLDMYRESGSEIPIVLSGVRITDNSATSKKIEDAKDFLNSIMKNANEIKIDLKMHNDEEPDVSSYGSPQGIVFVKDKKGNWINVNRTLLSLMLADPAYLGDTDLDEDEKTLWELDHLSGAAKAEGKIEGRVEKDPREKYLGEFNIFKEVRIGDVQIPIPPESISINTMSENIGGQSEIIRSKSSLNSNTGHEIKQIRLPIYIQGKEQINGTTKQAVDIDYDPIEIYTNLEDVDFEDEDFDPEEDLNKVQPTYYINGLRALLAQFKVAPFLPIDNFKINVTNNIDAVSLQNVTVSNVKNFPEVLKVELILVEFNHTVYIDGNPPFNDIFNWDLFRFNYQRLLEGTNMHYDRARKFPKIDSIDSEHFSMEIVTKSSLQAHEDAINFLDDIPKMVGGYTAEHEEGDFWSNIEDGRQFEYMRQQENQFKEMAGEYTEAYNKQYETDHDNLKELYHDAYQRTEDNTMFTAKYKYPTGIGPESKDENLSHFSSDSDGYSLLWDYNNWAADNYDISQNSSSERIIFDGHTSPGRYKNLQNFYHPIADPPADLNYDENKDAYYPVFIKSSENLSDITRYFENKIDSEGLDIEDPSTKDYVAINIIDNLSEDDYKEAHIMLPLRKEAFDDLYPMITDRGSRNREKHDNAIDLATAGSDMYEFKKIDFDNLYVQDISVSMSNNIKMSHINMQTKPAHQYLGSNQIQINVEAIVSDQSDVQMLNYIISHTRELTLRYSNIIKSPVLRLNNSIVDLFNIDGVYLETFNDETIPNMPGATAIQLSFIGHWDMEDGLETLTTRYKSEATKIRMDGQVIEGQRADGSSTKSTYGIENYLKIKDQLEKINTYPDLDLPRYNELPIKFYDLFGVKYDTEGYVDPDYYALNIDHMMLNETLSLIQDERNGKKTGVTAAEEGFKGNSKIHNFGEFDKFVNSEDYDPQEDKEGKKDETDEDEWPSIYFSENEFRSKAKGDSWDQVELTDKVRSLLKDLDKLRHAIGQPISITSSSRTREYQTNELNSPHSNSRHIVDDGNYSAVDIVTDGYTSKELMAVVEELDLFSGRGIYPQSNSQFIHVDQRSGGVERWKGVDGSYTYYSDSSFGGELNGVEAKIKNEDTNMDYDEREDIVLDDDEERINDDLNKDIELEKYLDGQQQEILNWFSGLAVAERTGNGTVKDFDTGDKDCYTNREIANMIDYTFTHNLATSSGSILGDKYAEYAQNVPESSSPSVKQYSKFSKILSAFILDKWKNKSGDKFCSNKGLEFDMPPGLVTLAQQFGYPTDESSSSFINDNLPVQMGILLAGVQNYYPLVKKNIDNLDARSVINEDTTSPVFSASDHKDENAFIISLMRLYGNKIEDDIAQGSEDYQDNMDGLQEEYDNLDEFNELSKTNNERENNNMKAHASEYAQKISQTDPNYAEGSDYEDFHKEEDGLINLRKREKRMEDTLYDMVRYDKRGRLVRAFPTYYLMFIDEGDKFISWKLQDIFYDYQGVTNIDLVRSKENVADVCYLELSNRYFNLANATGGYKELDVELDFFDIMKDMFNPWSEFNLDKAKRSSEINSVELQTGARIHLRLGYGSSPIDLPTVFNGRITELKLGEKIKLVAQNDGIELNRPFTDIGPNDTTTDEYGEGNIFESLKRPDQVFAGLFDYEDGPMNWILRETSRIFTQFEEPIWRDENKYGFRYLGHIGIPDWWDPDGTHEHDMLDYYSNMYERHNIARADKRSKVWIEPNMGAAIITSVGRAVFKEAMENRYPLNFEIAQNIYKVKFEPGKIEDDLKFSMYLYGKTPWEVMQTAAMIAPNYITAVHPFGITRNTIFYGSPLFDLAFDYEVNNLGQIEESLKTFRQFKFYGSFTDIISNNIELNDDIVTSVKPITADAKGDIESKHAIFLDPHIKPEFQKQINVDTSLYEPNIMAKISKLNFEQIPETRNDIASKTSKYFGVATLAQHVRKMYGGNIKVIGDPAVKPYDWAQIYDIESQVDGIFEVNTVIQSFNKQEGFTTTLEPDPVVISNYGDQEDKFASLWFNSAVHKRFTQAVLAKTFIMMAVGSIKQLGVAGTASLVAKSTIPGAGVTLAKSLASGVGHSIAQQAMGMQYGLYRLGSIIGRHSYLQEGIAAKWGTHLNMYSQRLQTMSNGIGSSLNYIQSLSNVGAQGAIQGFGNALSTTGNLGTTNGNLITPFQYAIGGKAALPLVAKAGSWIATNSAALATGLTIGVAVAAVAGSIYLGYKFFQMLDEEEQKYERPLTIMLLNHNNEPLQAGIDGSKGAVLGEDISDEGLDPLFFSDWYKKIAGEKGVDENREEMHDKLGELNRDVDSITEEFMQEQYSEIFSESRAIYQDADQANIDYKKKVQEVYEQFSQTDNDEEYTEGRIESFGEINHLNRTSFKQDIARYKGSEEWEENLVDFNGYTLHEKFAQRLRNSIVDSSKNSFELSTVPPNEDLRPLYEAGVALKIKPVTTSKQKLIDNMINNNLKAFHVEGDYVHVDLGPEYIESDDDSLSFDGI